MKKRLISMLLVLCMVFSLFPISVLAADEDSQTEEQTVFYVGEPISVTGLSGNVTISGYMNDEDWYVTDGLVLMYDGIYNAGMNKHDGTASSWVELTGSKDAGAIPTSGLTWSEYGLEVSDTDSGKASVAIDTSTFTYNVAFSGENCSDMVANSGNGYFSVVSFYRQDNGAVDGHIGSLRGDGVVLNYHAKVNSVLSTNASLKDNVVNSLAITSNGDMARSAFLNGKYLVQTNKGPDSAYAYSSISIPANKGLPNAKELNEADGKPVENLTLQKTVYGLRVYDRELSQKELEQNMSVDQARFENDSYTAPGKVTAGGETKTLTECTFENGKATVGKTKVTADGSLSVTLNREGSYKLTFKSDSGTEMTKDVTIISKEEADQADAVKQRIEDLPDAADLTIDNRQDVASAQAAYNQLSKTQKTRVGAAAKAKLDTCVAKIDELADGSLPITLIYEPNHGMLNPTEVTVYYKQNYTLDVPTRPGFRFDGWYLEDTDTQLTDAEGNSLSPWMALEGATVTAHWTNNAEISGATLEIRNANDVYALARILDKNNKGTKADYERFGYSDVSDTAKANLQKATYVLQNNITLTDQNNTFYGIPDFMGVFDGNGKTINVDFALAGKWGQQAFGCLFSSIDGGTVKNVNFAGTLGMKSGEAVTATTSLQDVAVVAGSTKNGATLENITSSVTMDLRFETTAGNTCVYAGAMVGRASGGSDRLINCINTGDLTGAFTGFQANGGCRLGGLVGHAYAGVSFANCENCGDIDVSGSNTKTLPSGMSGSGSNNVYTNCVLSGNVKSNGYAAQAYRDMGAGSTGNVIRVTINGKANDVIGYSADETVSVTLDASDPTAQIDIPIENVNGITENNAFSYKQYLTVNGLRLDWYNIDSTELTLKLNASQAADLEVPFQTEADALVLKTEEDLLNLQKALNDGDAAAIAALYAKGGKTPGTASVAVAALKTAYYKLGNDITVTNSGFTGIGKSGTPFSGHFDGQDKTVTLMRAAEAEATSIYALFGELNSGANGDAVVKNLTVKMNADVQLKGSNSYAGALAGYIGGCELHNVKAIVEKLNVTGTTTYAAHIGGLAGQGGPDIQENVSVEVAGPMTATVEGDSLYLGGLYGSGKIDADNPATVTYKNGATLIATKQKGTIAIGGLIGYAAYGTIDLRGSKLINESDAPLAISAETTGSVYAGGLVGYVTDATSAADSWIYADATTGMKGEFSVTAQSTSNAAYAGGVVGAANQSFSVSISDYTNCAVVTGKHAGGLVGSIAVYGDSKKVIFENCANEAAITGNANNDGYAGGLAGRLVCNNIQLTNCTNTGAVQNSSNYEGGLVGNTNTNNGGTVTITDCLNLGEVSSTNASSNYVGGFVGLLSNNDTVTIKNSANGGALSGSAAKNCYLGGLIGNPQQATITCEDALYLKTDTITKGIAVSSVTDVAGMIALDTTRVADGLTNTPIENVLSATKPEALTVSANAELDDTSLTYKRSGEQDVVFSWNGTKLYEKTVQVTASGTEYRVYCYFETVDAKGKALVLTDAEKIRVGLHPAGYGSDGWYVYGRLITETDLATKNYKPGDEFFQTILGELSGPGFSVQDECSGTFDEKGYAKSIAWKELNWHADPYKHTGYSQDGEVSAYHLDGTVTFYNVTFDANAGDDTVSGDLPQSGHCVHDAVITLPKLEREGYEHVGWTVDDTQQAPEVDANNSYTIHADVTLKAQWRRLAPTDEEITAALSEKEPAVTVQCVTTKPQTHTAHTYAAKTGAADTYVLGDCIDFNGMPAYQVSLQTSAFVDAYVEEEGTHTVKNGTPDRLTWVIAWNGTQWIAEPYADEADASANNSVIEVTHKKPANVHLAIYKSTDLTKAVYSGTYASELVEGDTLDLTTIDVSTLYSGNYEIDGGWYGDYEFGLYQKYVAGERDTKPADKTELVIDGNWQNLFLVITDVHKVVYFGSAEDLAAYQKTHDASLVLFSTSARAGAALPTADAPIAEREGYSFTFWSREGAKDNVSGQTVGGWTNLYANWKINQYTITFDTDGGSTIDSITQDYGTEITAPENPTKAGYKFTGWDKKIPTTMPAENMTITATWEQLPPVQVKVYVTPYADGNPVTPAQTSTVLGTYDAAKGAFFSGTLTTRQILSGDYDNEYQDPFKAVISELETSGFAPASAAVDTDEFYQIAWDTLTETEDGYEMNGTVLFYDVQFDVNGGDALNPDPSGYYLPGTVIPLPTPMRTGYSFVEWKEAETSGDGGDIWTPGILSLDDGDAEAANTYTVDGAVTLVAQWQPNKYTVSFDANGGELVSETKTLGYGSKYGNLPTTTREGYTFLGWFTEAEGGQQVGVDVKTVKIANDHTLYAHWQANTYEVVFEANGGKGEMAPQQFTYDAEQKLAKNLFTRNGYAFIGWNTEKDGSGETYTDEKAVLNLTAENGGAITLYAQWEAVSYTVAFYGNGGKLSSNPEKDKTTSPGTIGQPLTLKNANTFVREHYDFVGWATKPDATEAEYKGSQVLEAGYPGAVAGETYDLYAVWKKHVYTVAISASLGGEKLGWIANANVTVDENLLEAVNAKLNELHSFQQKSILAIWEAGKTEIVGYHADREKLYSDEKATVIADDALIFDGTTTLVYINYLPNTDTPYTVEHYQEQLGGTYALVETENLTGTTDTEATATDKGYIGFTVDKTVEGTLASGNIAGDGSLVLKLYYTRNSYTVKFDSVEVGATPISPVTVKYQQCVADVVFNGQSLIPSLAGHTFLGWYDSENYDGTPYTFDTQVTGDITLYAKWEKAKEVTITTPVYVFFKPVDANGNNITLDEPTLARVHLTYNTDSKDWFTYGKMDARTKLALDAESYAKDSTEFSSVVAELGTEAFVRYEDNKDFAGGSKITWNGLSKVNWEHYGYDVTDKSFHLDGSLTFYSVAFDANAGEDEVFNMPANGVYYDGEQLLVVASPMRPGYRFTGWFKDAVCTEQYTFTENGITENLNLYAGWEEVKAANTNVPVYAYFRPVDSKGKTITLDETTLARTKLVYNSGAKDWFTFGKTEVFAALTDASYGADSTQCKNAADALVGESFTRHEDNKDFAGTEKIGWFELKQVEAPHLSFAEETGTAYHLDGEITFFSMTFNANAGTDTVRNLPESGMYYDGERLPASIAPSRDGYVFGGWYDDAECTIAHTFTTDEVTEDITVYAKWTVSDPAVITYKLTINYVYANGTEAAESKVLELVPGAEYNETSPYISGYRADKAVVKGTMPDHTLTETVTYTRRRTSSGSTSVVSNPLKFNTAEHFAYVNGYPDGTVRPEGNITRAEVAAILYRIMDEACADKYKTTSSSYKDVARGDWFNTYVATLENAGVIVDTRTGGNFRPNEAITRAELATMLAQFATTTNGASSFKDVASSHWASREIAIAAKMGWINGYPDGTFRPDQTITRAEMMAMVNRALERTPESEDDLLSGMKTWSDNARTSAWYYLDVQEATNGHTYTKSGTHERWKKLAN